MPREDSGAALDSPRMSPSQFAATNILPFLARVVLCLAFLPQGWNNLMRDVEYTAHDAQRLRELGIRGITDPDPKKADVALGAIRGWASPEPDPQQPPASVPPAPATPPSTAASAATPVPAAPAPGARTTSAPATSAATARTEIVRRALRCLRAVPMRASFRPTCRTAVRPCRAGSGDLVA